MNVQELLAGGGGLLLVLTLVQIAPIKVNPWSWVGKQASKVLTAAGKALNASLTEELAEVKTRLTDLEKHNTHQDAERDKQLAIDARRRILSVADEIRKKVHHSEEYFNDALDDVSYYRNYCKTHPDFENSKAVISSKIIEETYRQCLLEDDFD